MKNNVIYIALCLAFNFVTFSQLNHQFEFDYSQFRADSSSNVIEIYYEFNSSELIKNIDEGDSLLTLLILFNVADNQSGKNILADTVLSIHSISELKQNNTFRNVIGVNKILLSKGFYKLEIIFVNEKTANEIITKESILVNPYDAKSPIISDIQLARSIKVDSLSNPDLFSKNTLRVIPNPSTTYSSEMPLLKYYAELYNVEDADSLMLSTYLVSGENKVVYSGSNRIRSEHNSIVHIDQINLLKYPSGIYTLQLILSDSTKEYAFVSQKQFYFYNKYYSAQQELTTTQTTDQKLSLFTFLSSEECDEIFEKCKYIATSREVDQYELLTNAESKRDFLFQFWQKRSDSSTNDPDESFKKYMNRVDHANQKFKGIRSSGYQSERGRIFITYGNPDRIENYPNQSNLKPYEIWYYDSIEGGVIFIFGDLNGFGAYDIIHSTKRGEIFDDTWQRRLYIY